MIQKVHIVRLADVPPQPWRNGGGSTRELLAWPCSKDSADWLLRVSVATIAQDGDFSAWPGMERHFAVIEGAGVRLQLPDGEHRMQPDSEPLRFDGEAAPGCQLLDGATLDLNLMLRRDAGHGTMRKALPGDCGSSAGTQAAWRGLYAADALTLVAPETDGAPMPVAAGTLLWMADDQAAVWRVQAPPAGAAPRAWWLSWSPR